MGTIDLAVVDSDIENDENISFKDLTKRQLVFQEHLQDLLRTVNEAKFESVVPQNRKELSNKQAEELLAIAKHQQEQQKQLLSEHKMYTEDIDKLNSKIGGLKENLKKFQNDLSVNREELKQITKPLVKAINKYSLNLDMQVKVKNLEDQNKFVASVKFSSKENNKSVDFIIDRKQRHVLDFNAGSLMLDEEADKLKAEEMTENGLNVNTILIKLRELCLK